MSTPAQHIARHTRSTEISRRSKALAKPAQPEFKAPISPVPMARPANDNGPSAALMSLPPATASLLPIASDTIDWSSFDQTHCEANKLPQLKQQVAQQIKAGTQGTMLLREGRDLAAALNGLDLQKPALRSLAFNTQRDVLKAALAGDRSGLAQATKVFHALQKQKKLEVKIAQQPKVQELSPAQIDAELAQLDHIAKPSREQNVRGHQLRREKFTREWQHLSTQRPLNKMDTQRLALLKQVKQWDDHLSTVATRHVEIAQVTMQVKRRLIAQALTGTVPTDAQGKLSGALIDDANKLHAYTLAAAKRDAVIRSLSDLYPSNTSMPFALDYSATGPTQHEFVSDYEVSREDMQKLPIVQAYQKLTAKAGSDPQAAAQAKAIEAVITDLQQHGRHLTGSVQMSPLLFKTTTLTNIDKISARTTEIEQRFNYQAFRTGDTNVAPPLLEFLRTVHDEQNQGTNGFNTKTELNKSYNALNKLEAIAGAFKEYEQAKLKNLSPQQLQDLKKFYLERVKSYQKFLRIEAQRVQREDESQLSVFHMSDSRFVSTRAARLNQQAQDLNTEIKAIEAIDCTASCDLNSSFAGLKTLFPQLQKMATQQTHQLMSRMIDQLDALPGQEKSEQQQIKVLRDNLDQLQKSKLQGASRIQAYQSIQQQIYSISPIRIASARIAMYKSFLTEERKANMPGRAMLKVANVFVDVPGIDDVTISEQKLIEIIAKYENIKQRLRSQDPNTRNQATQDFLNLENAKLHKQLNENFSDAQIMNFAMTVTIVAAAAMTGGLAAEAVAPWFIAGSRLGTIVIEGVNAAAFVGTERILSGAIEGYVNGQGLGYGFSKLAAHPDEFVGEVVSTAFMLRYINKSMQGFNKYFSKGVELVARRRVYAQMGLEFTATASKGARTSAAVEQAVKSEMALIEQSWKTQALKSGGGFAYEAAKFQQWQFYSAAGHYALNGHENPLSAAFELAFSQKSLVHGATFLLGLKACNSLLTPLATSAFKQVGDGSRTLFIKKELKQLSAEQKDLRKHLDHFLKTGEGNQAELMRAIDQTLVYQHNFLRAIPAAHLTSSGQAAVAKSRTEVATLIKQRQDLSGLMRHLDGLGHNKQLGIQWGALSPDTHTYSGNAKDLAGALKHEQIDYVRLKDPVSGGAVFIVEVHLPMGVSRTMELRPKQRPALIP